MHSIAVAGHLCLDITPRLMGAAALVPGRLVEVGPLTVRAGGSVANTGGSLAALGANVTPIASIGDDELGVLLHSELKSLGFTRSDLSMASGSTTSYSLVIESTGRDRTFWHHTGANQNFDGTEVDVNDRDIVHVGYPSLLPGMLANNGRPLRDLFERARAAGATTSLDLAVVDADSPAGALDWSSILHGAFAECDIASPSLDDLTSALRITEPYSPELVDRLADQMLDDGVAVVAISAGRHGLRIRTGSADRLRSAGAALAPLADQWANRSLTLRPGRIDTPTTTNGAGDASTAGLLYGVVRGISIEQASALAVACAAVSMSGGRTTAAAVSALDPTLTSLSMAATGPRP